jgi:hypothetical protein
MLTSKKMTLKPLLESSDGVHLTVYLVNPGKLTHLKIQLREAIHQASDFLNPVMSVEERNKFLEPLDALLQDSRVLRQMKGNIGLFRNQSSFRALNIPVDVEQTCQVATSFHVKPLLRWLQTDREFLLLGLENKAAHLYLGSQDSLKLVDSVLFPESFKNEDSLGDYSSLKKSRQQSLTQDETFAWLNHWISQLTKRSKPKIFLAGEKSLVDRMNRSLKYKIAARAPVANFFSKDKVSDICLVIRKALKAESRASVERALLEFQFAEESKMARKNIFQISKAAVEGRVRKLVISDDLSIFGKLNKKSGELAVHPFDLDHEDDDILDDLAQIVLSRGGEVILASQSEIPNGRPILAILDDDGTELDKRKNAQQVDVLQERFG